jgi:LPXTG-motif cell wall-anchored protein
MAGEAIAAIQAHPAFGAVLPGSGAPQIAATGVDAAPLAAAGLGIALVGLVLVASRRRARV